MEPFCLKTRCSPLLVDTLLSHQANRMLFWGAGMAQWWERSSPTNVARVRFRPSAIGGLSLLLVLALLRGFFSGFSGFHPSTKTSISKFQFDQDRGPGWKPAKADVASSLNILKFVCLFVCLFIYLFIYSFVCLFIYLFIRLFACFSF